MCKDNHNISININDYSNCYNNCDYYHYYDSENKSHCVFSCPENYKTLNEDTKECIKIKYESTEIFNKELSSSYPLKIIIETQKVAKNKEIKSIIKDLLKYEKNETVIKDKEKAKEEEIKYYDTILENIETGFTSEDYDTSNLDKGEDEVIETEKMTVTFTTTDNQKKNNISNNMTTIDLGECETLLREFYNISKNEILYMKKIDIFQEGMKMPKIEYDVYSKLSGNKLEKLNLSVCSNSKISLSVPVEISESLDKLNSSSDYYNDICYTTTSESGTDISLKDRKKDFVEGNKTVCQDECDFLEYDYNTNKANCSCKVKESSSSFADMNINKTKLYENFINIKNIGNFNLLVCYKRLFSVTGFSRNIGSYIIIVIILFHLVCIFIFYFKQLKVIMKIIKDIIYGIKHIKLIKDDKEIKIEEINSTNNIRETEKKIPVKKKKKNKKHKKVKNKKENKDQDNNPEVPYININNENKNELILNNINNNIIGRNRNLKRHINKRKDSSNIIQSIKKEKKIERVKNIMKYRDDEINVLTYDIATLYDKRSFL